LSDTIGKVAKVRNTKTITQGEPIAAQPRYVW
jgi:hypothetical protein